jgi:tetratricopeptide (TPR) repeat protein
MVLSWKILTINSNHEAPLSEEQIATHFTSINEYSLKIEDNARNADYFFGIGMDYMLVQDFAEAIANFSRAIDLNPNYILAYFNRAVVRNKQLDYDQYLTSSNTNELNSMNLQLRRGNIMQPSTSIQGDFSNNEFRDNKMNDYELILHDYDMIIRLNPDFVFAYYNRGNIRCLQRDYRAAIIDYSEAILRDPEFAEAYFNRGLSRLSLGDAERGIADLSKAGELGLSNAYNIIKRMTN